MFSGSKANLFGKQRLWGSVGIGVATMLAGYLVDVMSHSVLFKDYSILIYFMIFLIGMDLLCTYHFEVGIIYIVHTFQ